MNNEKDITRAAQKYICIAIFFIFFLFYNSMALYKKNINNKKNL